MGKDYRNFSLHKQVHRDMLKKEGRVHLPPNKVEATKKQYNRKNFNTKNLLRNLDM